MKTITLLRHAKSSWEYPELSDFDRPLLIKGIRRTDRIGQYLHTQSITPDLILTSGAKRAYETAYIMYEHFAHVPQIRVDETLYQGNTRQITQLIKTIPNALMHVMLVGHNPILTDLANSLCNGPLIDWMPTSSIVRLEFDITGWDAISKNKGRFIEFVKPKELTV